MADSKTNYADSEKVTLKDVRMDYADLWEPAPPMEDSKKDDKKNWRYRCTVIMDPDSEAYKDAKAAFTDAAKKLWGANAKNIVEGMGQQQRALRNGNKNMTSDGTIKENYAGKFYISASNKGQPLVLAAKAIDPATGKRLAPNQGGVLPEVSADGTAYIKNKEIDNPGYEIKAPYRGCRVNIKLWFVAQKAQPKSATTPGMPNQIYARFEIVQFNRDDDPFGPAKATAEGFGEGEDESEDDDLDVGDGTSGDDDDDIAF